MWLTACLLLVQVLSQDQVLLHHAVHRTGEVDPVVYLVNREMWERFCQKQDSLHMITCTPTTRGKSRRSQQRNTPHSTPRLWLPARTRLTIPAENQASITQLGAHTLAGVIGHKPASRTLRQRQRSRARLLAQDAKIWERLAEDMQAVLRNENLEDRERQLLWEKIECLHWGACQHEALA